ncbi:hypothetical protein [Acetobacter oeni]|uniref:Uncharacterized protein n=1 Tax=Acetobacter oeni TaxID=304077 RepID=A0A511XQU0_9PROT|nr:hypothetical protein [Acetobacter oeni]MBB3884882.1 hypothetical protein [Acetobacter oeni]NHO20829.1 hypothetical protein [Acetobacter oeni]GBR06346.1 hypothetical protein AA21952_1993 [Acetobacter oeni LMG 21952]GEN65323.1 hypothetical protein AOE01nite_35470 [Acetobacter oeni]
MLPVRRVAGSGQPSALVSAPEMRDRLLGMKIPHGDTTCDLYDYLSFNRVAGLLVMKDNRIVLEHYDLGIGPDITLAVHVDCEVC